MIDGGGRGSVVKNGGNHEVHPMTRPTSPYQLRRQEEERLGAIASVLGILAAILFVLITLQETGYPIVLPLPW